MGMAWCFNLIMFCFWIWSDCLIWQNIVTCEKKARLIDFCCIMNRTASLLPSKLRQSALSKLINDTVNDFDDDDLDNTLSQTGLQNGSSIKLDTNGSNGTHNLSNVSSLNSSSSGNNKDSPTSNNLWFHRVLC